MLDGGGEHGVVRAAGGDPRFGRGGQVRLGFPDGAGHRQLRQRLVRWYDVDLVDDQPEPVAEVADAEDGGRPGGGVEDEPDRVLPVPDAERMDLDPRLAVGVAMVGQTSSMWAPRIFGVPGPRW